jgi:DNA-directed RNA polymerase delta subunit
MNENKVTLRTKDYQKIKDLAQLRMKDPKYIAEAKALAKERGISISVETIFNEVMTLGDSLSDEEKKVILEIIASMAP